MEQYTWRTGGSHVTSTERVMSWHFRQADPEWGQMQSRHLHEELETALCDYPVSVVHKKGLVEIVPRGLHKGVAVREVLQRVVRTSGRPPGFVLCVGDDNADEHMFTAVLDAFSIFRAKEVSEEGKAQEGALDGVFTCTVGKKPSHAQHYVHSVQQVQTLLTLLASSPAPAAAVSGAAAPTAAVPPAHPQRQAAVE